MGGRGTASGLSSGGASGSLPSLNALTQQAQPEPAPAQQPAPQPAPAAAAASGLVSDTGVQDMDDATLTALIARAMSAPHQWATHDGRVDTPAQRIADALGLSARQPESVPQEALAQYRGGTYEQGTIYRTINDASGGKTARQLAHELTTSSDIGLNFGGGRAYGTGLYFAGTGHTGGRNAGANESAQYGQTASTSYTIEARIKPGARIATAADLSSRKAQKWALAHKGALRRLGLSVSSSGLVSQGTSTMRAADIQTTLAMLMGYDGFRNGYTDTPYYTIWNRGCLQVARGNKYGRADRGRLQ